ncbi:MAG: sulfatase [Anaerolineales bacterium]
MVKEYLLDGFLKAKVRAPSPRHVGVQPITIGFDRRTGLFQHPNSEVSFAPMVAGSEARLTFAFGVKEAAWNRIASPVRFEVWVEAGFRRHQLFAASLDPGRDEADRRWAQAEVDLAAYAHKKVRLILRTHVDPPGTTNYAWAGWAVIEVEHVPVRAGRTRSAVRSPIRGDMILITADALRADHLGCYGNTRVRTPSIDRLARDGSVFEQARSDTPVTPAAYAGMLTGLHVPRHGIWSEWGSLPRRTPVLADWLAARGYETVLAPSEAELQIPEAGFQTRFQKFLTCLGQPYQDGALTFRSADRWLQGDRARPSFVWIQLFDTHPPSLPPHPFSSQYYDGDPRDPAKALQADRMGRIRGLECLLEWDGLRAGIGPGPLRHEITERLLATAAALRSGSHLGPDLVSNLRALGADAMRGMSARAFADWLEPLALRARTASVPDELAGWILDVMPRLREVESEIIGWLKGVVDFRFPLAQYAGEISFLDQELGKFLDALRERDRYDSSLIVFTAPHGEILGESSVPLHHHALRECVLRVPLIVKWPAGEGPRPEPGSRVRSGFNLVDLAPTVLDSLGSPVPDGLDGRSRWPELLRREEWGPVLSPAFGTYSTVLAACDGRFKLMRALVDSDLDPDWVRKAGDEVLLDLRQEEVPMRDVSQAEPETAERLGVFLQEWINRAGLPTTEPRNSRGT